MSPQLARAGLQIGVWVTLVSGGLLFFEERQSAEFFISLITFLFGLCFTVAMVIAIKLSQR